MRTQREDEIEQGRKAIEEIRKNRSLPPHQKQSMIERIQMEVEENTGVKIDVESPEVVKPTVSLTSQFLKSGMPS